MSIAKIISFVFGIIFIILLYVIIYYALKIMYKDIKTTGKKKPSQQQNKFGIEVINPGSNAEMEKGSVFIVRREITIGRREDNMVVLSEPFVSGHHCRMYIKNNNLFVEDLNSTNGVYVNDEKITDAVKLVSNDEIKIGSTIFRVLKSK